MGLPVTCLGLPCSLPFPFQLGEIMLKFSDILWQPKPHMLICTHVSIHTDTKGGDTEKAQRNEDLTRPLFPTDIFAKRNKKVSKIIHDHFQQEMWRQRYTLFKWRDKIKIRYQVAVKFLRRLFSHYRIMEEILFLLFSSCGEWWYARMWVERRKEFDDNHDGEPRIMRFWMRSFGMRAHYKSNTRGGRGKKPIPYWQYQQLIHISK